MVNAVWLVHAFLLELRLDRRPLDEAEALAGSARVVGDSSDGAGGLRWEPTTIAQMLVAVRAPRCDRAR
jgi:hypothetical protein